MQMSNRNLYFLFFVIAFVVIGISGFYSAEVMSLDKSFHFTFKFLGIPIVFVAIFIVFYIVFKENKENKVWKKIVLAGSLILPISIMLFVFLTGWLLFINNFIGKPKNLYVVGKITKIETTESKMGKITYTLHVIRLKENDTLLLETRNKNFKQGEIFKKEMKIGSLGFLYSNEN